MKLNKKFKKVVVLDTVIFYPEHRDVLSSIAEEIVEFPSSLPQGLEKQYEDYPELFLNKKCYTQIAAINIPLQLLMNRVDGADVIISCWTDIPDEILKLNSQLKVILFWTHEKEHRVNLKLAEELGITVLNVPDYGTDSVAEVVFAGLWELIIRNNRAQSVETEHGLSTAIVQSLFSYFRLLATNEKNTRAGKFGHHFHKLGMIKFDFEQNQLSTLIPERLIANKKIGFLNVSGLDEALEYLKAFEVQCQTHLISDSSSAEYYKFLAEKDLVFYDSNATPFDESKKIKILFGAKLVDIRQLCGFGYQFKDKKFGIAGLGRIGEKVAKIADKLGFEVIYFSKNRKLDLEKELSLRYVSLEELVEESDIISIHVPAHKAENLLNAELIAKMKNGSMFINTADGNAIDQKALTQRMLKNEITSFLDVYPGLPRKDVLGLPICDKADWKLKGEFLNSVLAYRSGWKTQESIRVKTLKLIGEMTKLLV